MRRKGEGREPDEAAALASLREHEVELDRELEEAGRAARAVVAEAREEAGRLRERAESELAGELERLCLERARELEQALTRIREETELRCRDLRRRAEQNRQRALARLLSLVAGTGTP